MSARSFYERLATVEAERRDDRAVLLDVESRLRKVERALWVIGTILTGLNIATFFR